MYLWWGQQGLVLYGLLKADEIVTSDVYRSQLKKWNDGVLLLHRETEIADNRRKVILFHANVQLHIARVECCAGLGMGHSAQIITRHGVLWLSLVCTVWKCRGSAKMDRCLSSIVLSTQYRNVSKNMGTCYRNAEYL